MGRKPSRAAAIMSDIGYEIQGEKVGADSFLVEP